MTERGQLPTDLSTIGGTITRAFVDAAISTFFMVRDVKRELRRQYRVDATPRVSGKRVCARMQSVVLCWAMTHLATYGNLSPDRCRFARVICDENRPTNRNMS